MIIRGVSFQVPQGGKYLLKEVLDCTSVQTLFWYNVESQNEVWSIPENKEFFDKEYYDGSSFYEQIKLPHFVVFLKLQAYSKDEEYTDIHTYDEFLRSSCSMLVLIYDCEFVEIFSKSETLTEVLLDNAYKKGFLDVGLITDENDGRTVLDIL